MKKHCRALSVLLALALSAYTSVAQTSQSQGDQSKSSISNAGSATKSAAKDVGSATKSGTVAAADKVTGKIDINSASKDDLMKLDGVGEATSTKIIAARPYKTKRDLLTRKIVNQATYAKISDKIVAHADKGKTGESASK
jgi:DNA uptake protein ComE-like DNA-binding protein